MSRDSDNGNCQNAACKMKEQTLCNNMKDYELINTSIKENLGIKRFHNHSFEHWL